MSHVGTLGLASEMWKKFETLYRDTGFIERNAIFIRFSIETMSDFTNVAEVADNIKRNSTRLREIGTTDVPNWMYMSWFLHGLDSEYDSFRMMLTNNRKAEQAKETKTEPDFDSIFEQVLSLDTQKKTNASRSMKTAAKGNESKKPSIALTISCPYCSKGDHTEDKYYYKHPKRASESFRKRFKTRIADLRSRHSGSIKLNQDNAQEREQDTRNCGWDVRAQQIPSNSALSTGTHDTSWYFDNASSYHMTYNINDIESPDQLASCISPQDDITLADGCVILSDGN